VSHAELHRVLIERPNADAPWVAVRRLDPRAEIPARRRPATGDVADTVKADIHELIGEAEGAIGAVLDAPGDEHKALAAWEGILTAQDFIDGLRHAATDSGQLATGATHLRRRALDAMRVASGLKGQRWWSSAGYVDLRIPGESLTPRPTLLWRSNNLCSNRCDSCSCTDRTQGSQAGIRQTKAIVGCRVEPPWQARPDRGRQPRGPRCARPHVRPLCCGGTRSG
jgi:hypothetical protein